MPCPVCCAVKPVPSLFLGESLAKVPSHKVVAKGLALVPEGRRIFLQMTVQENLEMGAFTRRDTAGIREDLEMVFHSFPRLKERLRQPAGTLSGGEQQRIAIARAILKNAPILILDEATAFADPDNEVRVQQALSALSKGKTVIMIAHRLSSITDADCIYVLQDGEIVESGTHSGLIEKTEYLQNVEDYSEAAEWKIANGGKRMIKTLQDVCVIKARGCRFDKRLYRLRCTGYILYASCRVALLLCY